MEASMAESAIRAFLGERLGAFLISFAHQIGGKAQGVSKKRATDG